MKRFTVATALLLLAACSAAPSGTYTALDNDGSVARQGDGQPILTISLEDGTAALRSADGDVEMWEYKVVDGTVFITRPGTSEATALKVDGDRLLGTGMLNGMTLKKL